MGIGLGVVLLLLGLILVLDVIKLPASVTDHVQADTLGWILLIMGVLAIILGLVMNAQASRSTTRIEERRYDETQPPPQ